MLSSVVSANLPADCDRGQCRELFMLRSGLDGSLGESYFLAAGDRMLTMTRSSAVGPYDWVELAPGKLPGLEQRGWRGTSLRVETATGEVHHVPLASLSSDLERVLETLYLDREAWDDLAALLRLRLDGAVGGGKIDLLLRLGALYRDHLDDPSSALACFEEVLQSQSANTEALEGVGRILENGDLVQQTAPLLEATYRRHHQWDKLAGLLAARAPLLDTARERIDAWLEAAHLEESRLKRPAHALERVGQALIEDPDSERIHEIFERVSQKAARWERVVELLRAALESERRRRPKRPEAPEIDGAAGSSASSRGESRARYVGGEGSRPSELGRAALPWTPAVDEEVDETDGRLSAPRVTLLWRLAETLESRRGDLQAAAQVCRELLEIDCAHLPSLQLVARAHARDEAWSELVEVLTRCAELEKNDRRRARTLFRVGEVAADQLEDLARARRCFEQVLALERDHEPSVERLERIYREQGDWQALYDLLKVRVVLAREAPARARYLAQLGELAEQSLNQPERAIEHWEAVIELVGEDEAALAALVRLYGRLGQWVRVVTTLERRAAVTGEPEVALALLEEAARVAERRLDSPERALQVWLGVGSELARARPVLEAIARLAGRLGRDEVQIEALRALLDHHARILEERVDWRAELAALLEQTGEVEGAMALWREQLVDLPGDEETCRALLALYDATERWADAVDVLEDLREAAAAGEPRARLSLELGRRWERQHEGTPGDGDAFGRAVEAYRDAMAHGDGGTRQEADTALEGLLRRQRDWPALVDHLLVRSQRAGSLERQLEPLLAAVQVVETEQERPRDALALLLERWPLWVESRGAGDELARLALVTDRWPEVVERAEAIIEHNDRKRRAISLGSVDHVFDAIGRRLDASGKGEAFHEALGAHFERVRDDDEEAALHYRRALRHQPDRLSARMGLLRALRRARDWRELARELESWASSGRVRGRARRDLYLELADVCGLRLADPERAKWARDRANAGRTLALMVAFSVLVLAVVLWFVLAVVRGT